MITVKSDGIPLNRYRKKRKESKGRNNFLKRNFYEGCFGTSYENISRS